MEIERYFEAKTLLKSISDAHICVKTSIREKNLIQFKQYQLNNLYDNLKNNYINLNNNEVIMNDSFKNSNQNNLNFYIKNLKNKYLDNLKNYNDYKSIKEFLKNSIENLK